jgi:glycosyltransferase involved in cell wall biosynthesis
MKLLLVIDHFGSGGAQRQLVELACGLKRRGHTVELFVYFPQHNFFRARLDAQRIVVHEQPKGSGGSIKIVWKLAALMRRGAFDVVVSYLSTADIYAELAKVGAHRARLVVSERTSRHDDKSAISALLRRLLHVFADQVVANSETHAAWLRQKPWLKHKVSCIYNGVDLDAFQPKEPRPAPDGTLRLLAVGRVGSEKNLVNLILALASFEAMFGYVPLVGWAGQRDESAAGRRYCREVDALLEALPQVRRRWQWLGLQGNIPQLLERYDALIHPSLYEGLPNVVCEALAVGMPVLVSDVCDHGLLVADGSRGFLFDPTDSSSIAAAIAKLVALGTSGRCAMGRAAREYAVANLSMEKMIDAYEALFASLHRGRKCNVQDQPR